MIRFSESHRRSLLGGAALLALAFGGAPAWAQDANSSQNANQDAQGGSTSPVDPAATAENDEQGIVVTGFRASLENAVNEKKRRDQIVESISAEDIGKLPDASIAESIARLPGLTSQRVSGRSNSISIRGFGPDFSTTLLNGREQTSTGDNRAVEYDQYPSEVINQVLVYKTPMANLVGQGLSGTVDLRTIRPLEYGKHVFSVGARGTYSDLGKLNAGSHDLGYRVNAVFVTQNADDTVGLSLAASYNDEPYQIQEFNSWGYPTIGPNGGPPAVIGGSKSYVTSTQLKRLGLQGTLEFRPLPNFTTTIDAFYSDFSDDQIKRGIELPLYWGGAPLQPGFTTTDGIVSHGTFTGVEGVVRNDAFQRHAKLYSVGWNGRYEGDDGWNIMGDASFSKTDRNELVLESNAGTGRGAGVGATDTIGFTSGANGTRFTHNLNYGDYNLILLTSPLGWGGDQTGVNGDRIINGQDGYYNNRIIKDELWQFRAQVEKELDGFLSGIQFGADYTHRGKRLTPDESFIGLVANTNGTVSVKVPEQFRMGTTDLTYLGLGPVISYDPIALLKAGIYKRVANPYGDVVVKAYDISEDQKIVYGQANIRSAIGASELTGNFGVQAIWTDQRSRGASAIFLGTNPNGSPNIGGIPRNEGAKYLDVLPSLNLSLRLPSDFVIRFAAAREMIRPRLDDLKASLSYGTSIITQNGVPFAFPSGSSGNPQLRPWRANALDLTFEKYWGTKGYLALQLFWKDLRSYIYNQTVDFNFAVFPIANQGTYTDANGVVRPIPFQPIGDLTVPINGKGGKLYGAELAATLPFSTFTAALDGFGVTGGVSYTHTSIAPTPGAPPEDIPGYSKWVANGTAYFEKWGFSARGSVRYRSTFIGEVSGFGASRVRRRAAAETIVDAQIGYEFPATSAMHGLSLFLQGQNLTDEPFVTFDPGQRLHVIDYQRYGRRFLAGFNFKF
ncbi:MAG: TonB-dependent receptor [Alphaproteobacteria bacterium]|nr:TonB-dependent receptor [Alphaproteobacteria bacterium]MBV9370132.1 TonB-dependent receptor [Alphaproteobacteria bacterium]MBV9901472.1 TonB-dependent receptor [Alphaproteobacteria bacterium]